MKHLGQELTEREARRASLARSEPTPYANALNRYLSAQGYAVTPARVVGGPVPHSVPEPVVCTVPPADPQPVVIVGVDGSPGSFVALDHAAIEAELRGWEIRLVHVQHPTLVRRKLFEQRDRGAALLAEMGERIRARVPDLPVSTALKVGIPGQILLSESTSAGLTVLGHRGYSIVGGMLSQSLALHLATHSAVPLLIVRVPGWPPGEGWQERPVLVGVDGSPGGRAALEFGLAEARLRGSHLLAMHATGSPATVGRAGDPLRQGRLAGDEDRVDSVRVRRRAIDGDAVEALVASSAHASAVVVGSRGDNGLGRALPGGVGRALAHRAHCPVFIVPSAI